MGTLGFDRFEPVAIFGTYIWTKEFWVPAVVIVACDLLALGEFGVILTVVDI